MNPAFLLGTAFNIAYWHRKYHSGTICKGVSNPQTSNAFTGCDKEEIPKCEWECITGSWIPRAPMKGFGLQTLLSCPHDSLSITGFLLEIHDLYSNA